MKYIVMLLIVGIVVVAGCKKADDTSGTTGSTATTASTTGTTATK